MFLCEMTQNDPQGLTCHQTRTQIDVWNGMPFYLMFIEEVGVDEAGKVQDALNRYPWLDLTMESFSVAQINEQCIEITINSPRGMYSSRLDTFRALDKAYVTAKKYRY